MSMMTWMVTPRRAASARTRASWCPAPGRGGYRGTGQRVADRRVQQFPPAARRDHGGTAGSCADSGPAAAAL